MTRLSSECRLAYPAARRPASTAREVDDDGRREGGNAITERCWRFVLRIVMDGHEAGRSLTDVPIPSEMRQQLLRLT